MYQALYRKWRPKTFDDVVGQAHITETLKNQVRSGRLSHAYLFIGTRGTGKTTCAKILAKAVNCEHPVNGNPCNACAACRGIDDGTVLDVVEMDAASNNSVDDVRLLRDEAIYSPANAKKRVYIVDEVHMLSKPAFNALLKILEEPPEHLMFILATTELHKVPATILSRCQRHSFKRLRQEDIVSRLQYVAAQEQIGLEPEAAALLARLADGGMRDALTLLDQCSGAEHITADAVLSSMGMAGQLHTAELLEHIAQQDTAAAMRIFRTLWQEGKDPATVLDELATLQRDALMRAIAPQGSGELLSGGFDEETLDRFRAEFGSARLMANLNCLQETLANMAQSVDPRLSAELCLIRLCRPELQTDPAALAARIEALEAGKPAVSAERKAEKLATAPKPPEDEPIADLPPWDDAPPPPPIPEEPPVFAPPPFPVEEPIVPPLPFPEPDPVIEPDPPEGKAPETDPIPEPVQATAVGTAAPDWNAICQAAEAFLNTGQFSLLRNPNLVKGILADGVLTLEMDRALAYMVLNTPETVQKLRQAANACGSTVDVRIVPSEAQAQTERRSLEELARFENVEFK